MGNILQSLSVGGIISNPLALCMCVWGCGGMGERQRDSKRRNRLYTMSINKVNYWVSMWDPKFFLPFLSSNICCYFMHFWLWFLSWRPYLPLWFMLESVSTRHSWNWSVYFRSILAIFFLFCTALKFMKLICSDPNKSRNKTLLILWSYKIRFSILPQL